MIDGGACRIPGSHLSARDPASIRVGVDVNDFPDHGERRHVPRAEGGELAPHHNLAVTGEGARDDSLSWPSHPAASDQLDTIDA